MKKMFFFNLRNKRLAISLGLVFSLCLLLGHSFSLQAAEIDEEGHAGAAMEEGHGNSESETQKFSHSQKNRLQKRPKRDLSSYMEKEIITM